MSVSKFYNYLTAVVIVVGGIFLGAKLVSADELNNLQHQALAPVVQLHRNCSGVVVNTSAIQKTYIVTANHCVSDRATPDPEEKRGVVTIDTKDRAKLIETNEYVYDVILRDVKQDLAVIKLRKEGLMLEGASIATEDPKEGEKVWTVGYPLGLTRTVTEGNFGNIESMSSDLVADPYGDARPMYRATPPIFGGNSGGGMFIKRGDTYQLAGISDVVYPMFFVAGYYVPQDAINDVLKRALDSETKTEKVTVEQKKVND